MDYDVIVVGGGIAGAASAIRIAKAGVKCAVFEKRAKGISKVCGGGLTYKSIQGFRKLGFSPEFFLDLGGIKINRELISDNGSVYESPFSCNSGAVECSIGISRDVLDTALWEHLSQMGVDLYTGHKIRNISISGSDVKIDGYSCTKAVIATGSNSNIKAGIKESVTVGISAEVLARADFPEVAFQFIYDDRLYKNGYAWIFPIGHNKWNAGVWMRKDYSDIKRVFERFWQEVFLPKCDSMQYLRYPRGGIILSGAAKPYIKDKNIYFAGDCANCACTRNGEGISQALRSGISAADAILKSI